MANFTVGDDITRGQGADLTGKLFYIVKFDTVVNQVVLAAASTDKIVGVISRLNQAASTAVGAPVNIHVRNASGTFKVVAGGVVAIGDALTSNASAQAITTVTAGDQLIGYASEVGVTGQVIEYVPTSNKF